MPWTQFIVMQTGNIGGCGRFAAGNKIVRLVWRSFLISPVNHEPWIDMPIAAVPGKWKTWLAKAAEACDGFNSVWRRMWAEITFRNSRLSREWSSVGVFIGLALPAIKRNEMIDTIK
jgi:hypothetical protein